MCGINGILRLDDGAPPVDPAELLRTRDAMRTRGPDGEGLWCAEDGGIGLGHRRLAIIDLSPGGLQPMAWGDGRYRIVFNGEIYNYRELRSELTARGVRFRTQSDTEVILALYADEGEKAFSRLRGMYGLALWDEREQTLVLARDPYGIKPLYYAVHGGTMRFASQVKALQASGALPREPDPAGVVGFLLWGSVPEPSSVWKAIRAVPAGHTLRVERGRVGEPRPHTSFETTLDAPSGEVDLSAALEDSVRAHLVADVPVALFLSAGLDSALIAALAKRQPQDEPLTTITLRFDRYRDTIKDEAPLAAEVARALGTRHIERLVTRDEFPDLWHSALAVMDQPSIDGFNTYVVSRVAHEQGLKVVMSGLGGDELMGSYESFRDVPRWVRWSALLRALPGAGGWWPAVAHRLRPHQPKLAGLHEFGANIPAAFFLRRALYLPAELPDLLGASLAREGLEQYDPVLDCAKYLGGSNGVRPGAWEAVHLMESSQFMRNQLLRDCDWASMAHSLELRVPLVDVALRRAMARARFEPARSRGKAAVVRRAAPELPDALWRRPKSGFSIPVMDWLDDELGLRETEGLVSRRLALRVLEGFGIELPRERANGAA